MIYITGDTHGQNDIQKLFPGFFSEGKNLTREDYLIITGDFGGIWYGDSRDDLILKFYEEKKYTILFVDGNHENFSALNSYPIEKWNGGKIHRIRENIIHLMRGQVYEIEGKTFFTFGGGLSIDKEWRIPNISWWKEEWPSQSEINEAFDNLSIYDNKIDYVITHAAPQTIMRNEICQIHPMLKKDCLTEKFLDEIYKQTAFKMWFCGHYHLDAMIYSCNIQVLYKKILKLVEGYPIVSQTVD